MKKFFCCIITTFLSMLCTMSTYADTYKPTFYAYPVLPSNQINDNAFFDVKIAPKQTQNLILAIKNETNANLNVQIEAITATTAQNGEILYSQKGIPDKSILVPFDSLFEENPKQVTIPPKTEIEVAMKLTMPSTKYTGIILGAFHISDTTTTSANKYSYTIAARLSNLAQTITPSFELTDTSITTQEQTSSFSGVLRNTQPELYKRTHITTHIAKDNTRITSNEQYVDFAPNSIYTLDFSHNAPLEDGEYQATIYINTGNDTITITQAVYANKEDSAPAMLTTPIPNKQSRNTAQGPRTPLNPAYIALIILIPVIFFLFIRYKITKKEK